MPVVCDRQSVVSATSLLTTVSLKCSQRHLTRPSRKICMAQKSADILIIGGGVIGLAIAAELGRRGGAVTVLSQAQSGQAAPVAAGMLAPLAEASKPGPFLDLTLDSLRSYPEFLARLREESGMDIRALGPGMLRVARTDLEEAALCRALAWQSSLGLPLHPLTGDEARHLEPALSPQIRAALLSPAEMHLPPLFLLEALTRLCVRCRVQILSETPAIGLECTGDQVTAVVTPREKIACGKILFAAGAWNPILADWLGYSLPIRPLRGQIQTLGPSLRPLFRHTLYTHGSYLVPRPGGEIIAGATEEEAGYEAHVTSSGIRSLHAAALTLVPALAFLPPGQTHAGLRPVSADGLPLLGRIPGWENVHIAAGHGRNGILLTPITGTLMADALLHEAPLPPAFDPARFGEAI